MPFLYLWIQVIPYFVCVLYKVVPKFIRYTKLHTHSLINMFWCLELYMA